jgi:hypothetical protein
MSLYEELKKLDELRQDGLLSEQEFQQQKSRLLAGGPLPRPTDQYGQPEQSAGHQSVPPVMPKTYFAEAILVTLFCCLPVGIPAIVKSAQVSGAFAAGNYSLAKQRSAEAAHWAKLSAILGASLMTLYILVGIIAAVSNVQ